eukprot:sb/3478407/
MLKNYIPGLKSKFSTDGDFMGTLQPRRLLKVDLRIEKRSFCLMVAKVSGYFSPLSSIFDAAFFITFRNSSPSPPLVDIIRGVNEPLETALFYPTVLPEKKI